MTTKLATLIIIVFFFSSSSFSQFTQAWTAINNLNPAMVGLDYKSSGNVMFSGDRARQGNYSAAFGNYSGFISKYNIGFGISTISQNTTWESDNSVTRNLTKLNANKQFLLKNNMTFSTGVGVGLSSFNHYHTLFHSSETVVNRSKGLGIDVGFALKGERLRVGLSGGYQFPIDNGPNNQVLLNVFASYTFGKEDGLQFTPHVLLSQIGPSIGGTFNYKSKFMLGGGMSSAFYSPNHFRPYVTAGYTINEKFNINYTYNFQDPSPYPKARHELSLGFKFGKR